MYRDFGANFIRRWHIEAKNIEDFSIAFVHSEENVSFETSSNRRLTRTHFRKGRHVLEPRRPSAFTVEMEFHPRDRPSRR